MNKHIAPKSLIKRSLKAVLAGVLVTLFSLGSLTVMASSAQAISVDASQANFSFFYPTNGTLLSGTDPKNDGAVVKFSNVTGTPISGITIDAIVTNTFTDAAVTNYDNRGNASSFDDYFQVNTDVSAALGTTSFKFDFYEGGTYTGPGTGTPVILNNVSVTSIDLDGSNSFCQFSDFTGFQSYALASNTSLLVKTHSDDANIPLGTTRFLATSCTNNTNRVEDAVQVKFDSVTTFTATFGTDRTASPNYFGIAFKPLSAVFGITQPASINNPSNQPPTSSNTTRYYVNGQPSVVQLADFGNFADPDGNPFIKVKITTLPTTGTLEKFVNGSWVAVSVNDEILVSDITNGNLRFTGTVNDTLQFQVSDGSDYSVNAYTMTLLVSNQSQAITFNNPGAKTPTSPSFASGATASSGLTVTLTSLTPGVCTVSGLNIVPVAAGICTIVASQAGNSTYGAATSVTQTFPISTLTPQTITAPNPGNQTWGGSSSTITVSPTATSGLTVGLISLSPAVCTVSGFVITIVGPGNCTIRNVQAGNVTYSSAPPVEYTFVVAAPVASHTITYDGNTKTSGSVPSNTTGNGAVTLATNSGTLAKTGYTFTGWNTQADGNGTHYAVSTSYNLTADVTLYAEWTAVVAASYTITFDGNTNTGGTAPAVITGAGSKTLRTNTGTLAKTNYTFKGWNTAADGTGTHYNVGANYNLTADVTLYAEWTLTPAVIYNSNGATGGTKPGDVPANNPVTIDPNTGNLVRAGYRFLGWNTEPDGSGTAYAAGETPTLPVGTVLYASWEKVDSLASTGSDLTLPIELAAALLGLGLTTNAISAIRRRRFKA